ncbi:endonuclease domain-containing protein [Gordonia humi]|uniref:Very-short-patch-repair endonuclease n=1 Tax=Gordonia humi TaxID=686429 RepID=A0A840F7N2_9ACTN|nr:endonuclease domain-containing protein [Gordonia humi]MBB4135537.1 very-short-patch-repair endonuclease [Gordonia humi]
MIRSRLLTEQVKLDIQVTITGVGRVDLLVGDWLIIELDGWEFHGDKPHFNSDRTRMVDAQNLGYTDLPFTYEHVAFDDVATHRRIMTAIRNGAHRRPSQLA